MSSKASFTTVNGRYIRFDDLSPSDISIWDIAHSLSRLCRYVGHVQGFYSVAEHSVIVSRLAANLVSRDDFMKRNAVGGSGVDVNTYLSGEHELAKRETARNGLVHDFHEAFFGDTAGPLKVLFRQHGFTLLDELEAKADGAIRSRFNMPELDDTERARIKEADHQALLIEQARLRFIDSAAHANHVPREFRYSEVPVTNGGTMPVGLSPDDAKQLLLNEFRYLKF